MRTLTVAAMVTASLCGPALVAQTLPADDSRIAALGEEDPARQIRASQELIQVGGPAIPPLVSVLDQSKEKRTAAKMAYQTLFRMVQICAGTDRSAEIEAALVGELRNEHPVETKRRLCVLLSYTAEENASIDTLYVALNYPELENTAIWALANVTNRRATQCLMGALQITRLDARIAAVDALGLRGDPMAASYLAPGIHEKTPALGEAVLEALARLPAPQSFQALGTALGEKQPGAISAMIAFMETLLDAKLDQGAEFALKTLGEPPAVDPQEKCRLLHACGRLGNKPAVDYVIAALKDENPRIRAAAVQACALFPGKELTTTVAEQMAKAPGALRIDLIEVLGKRGQWMNDTAAGLMVSAITDPAEPVRLAAIQAVEQAGVESAMPALLRAMAGPPGPIRDAAEHAVNWLPGKAATQAIVQALGTASPEMRGRLLLALGRRGDSSVLPVLTQAKNDPDPAVQAAASKAIGLLGLQAASTQGTK
jgi:HEAT repeat protein